jgi:hypothetical protein
MQSSVEPCARSINRSFRDKRWKSMNATIPILWVLGAAAAPGEACTLPFVAFLILTELCEL